MTLSGSPTWVPPSLLFKWSVAVPTTPSRSVDHGPHGSTLRIAHLGKFFRPAHGGIERFGTITGTRAGRIGCSVRVICMDHERGRATRVEWDGPVEVVRIRRPRALEARPLPRPAAADPRIRGRPAAPAHAEPVDDPRAMLSGDRRPLVVSHHSDVIKQRLRRLLFSPMERACYDRARLVLAMSPPYWPGRRSLRRYADRVAVLPIGLDLAPYLSPSPEVAAHGDDLRRAYPGPLWFSCGRLVYYKGLETALHALRSVPGTLLIAGDGPARSRLERLAAQLDLRDRVRFLGKVDRDEDLIAHLLAADAYWFPSNARSEAFGVVQIEAMASGCPVINTAIPHSGVPWVSRHEETGLTVPVDDPSAFAAAARRLLEEPGLRDRLAAGARARAIAEFQCEAMGRRSLEHYAAILAAARRDAGLGGTSRR